jgi:hypothetical protein
MNEENYDDIRIGENEVIQWIEVDFNCKEQYNIDYIIDRYRDFWLFLEIFCIAECCGLNAFRFYPEDIIIASNQIDKNALKKDLNNLIIDINNTNYEIVTSSRLNNLINKQVFIKLLLHIIKNLP